jgi:hypothetical protein
MNKQILIPASSLAEPEAVSFLELSVEPDSEPNRDPFRMLGGSGLDAAVATARRALHSLPPADLPACVRLAGSHAGKALTNSAGAALGLALGPLLLHHGFPYRRYLIMGSLYLRENLDTLIHPNQAEVGGVQHTLHKLRAIQRRGYQIEPMLFLLARDGLAAETEALLRALIPLNIAVRRVENLEAAYRACGGFLPQTGEGRHVHV